MGVSGRCRNALGVANAFNEVPKGKAGPSVRPDNSQIRARRPRVSVVAAQLAAVRDEPAVVGRASRLGVALARRARELSTARREIVALRRENAALKSELGAGGPKLPSTGPALLGLVDLELPGGPSAPRRACSEIRRATAAVLADDDSATATLLTSELVTNAVVHPQQPDHTSIGLRIIPSQNRLRVEVTDSGSGFDPATLGRREPDRAGRGLLLVARLSDRWGTTRRTGARRGFCVWFELNHGPRYSRRTAVHT